jgi:hypothetical protein
VNVPYGGAGWDIDGLLMAGMTFVAIEKSDYMINAIKVRASVISARFEDHAFDLDTWTGKLEKWNVGFGGDGEEEDNDGGAGGAPSQQWVKARRARTLN